MQIALSPNRRLYVVLYEQNPSGDEQVFEKKFNANQAAGLMQLVKFVYLKNKSQTISYWRQFSTTVFRQFCENKHNNRSQYIDAKTISSYLSFAPNMKGGEYLDTDTLKDIWKSIEDFLNNEVKLFAGDTNKYLQINYPQWAQVGKVHFHFAESKDGSQLPFAFLATYTTRVSDKARLQHLSLGSALQNATNEKNKLLLSSLLEPIKKAAISSEFLEKIVLEQKIFRPIYLSATQGYSFLQDIDTYKQAGIVVKLPDSWEKKKPAKAKVSIKIKDGKTSFVDFNSLFKFSAGVSIDGKSLSDKEIKDLLAKEQPLVKINGKWIEVNTSKLTALLAKWQKAVSLQDEGLSFAEALKLLSTKQHKTNSLAPIETKNDEAQWLETVGSEKIKKVLSQLASPANILAEDTKDILEQHLRAQLRPYQYDGLKWLSLMQTLGLGICLADDMGLGKTIQIIALLLVKKFSASKNKNSLVHLLVVPTSLLGNWQIELNKFAPKLKYKILHSAYTPKEQINSFATECKHFDIIITTYNMLIKTAWLRESKWEFFILDEAQAIKNPLSQKAKIAKSIQAKINIALTGTPIENNLSDLWSIFDFINPNLLGASGEFRKFCTDANNDSYKRLRKLITPYILRRKKTDKSIISDLPEKIELASYCMLSKEQVELYRKTITDLAGDLKTNDKDNIKRKGLILSYLMKFKQICNHPSQMLADNDYTYNKSGKFLRLQQIAEVIAARGEKLLLFTQFKEIIDILDRFLAEIFAQRGFSLHGATPVAQRKSMVEEFQQDDSVPYFILSLKAGGVGLNLTKASHVIHFDRWWNPAVEDQATDRAFRIGQQKNVMVHKFICKGTIEERIDLMIKSKKSLADSVVERKDSLNITQLSNTELMSLVSLDIKS
jgi:SNF2 family DNA or RNA helicase